MSGEIWEKAIVHGWLSPCLALALPSATAVFRSHWSLLQGRHSPVWTNSTQNREDKTQRGLGSKPQSPFLAAISDSHIYFSIDSELRRNVTL